MKQYIIGKKKSRPSNNVLLNAVNFLTQKFRKAHQWRFTAYSDGQIKQIPSSIRGNDSYAYFQSFRLDNIQQQFYDRLLTDHKTHSNILFNTHTLKYNPDDPIDIKRVWMEGQQAIEPFLRKMRKLGMIDYCLTIEAFDFAGFHIHIAVIFDHQLLMKKTIRFVKGKWKKIYRLTDLNLLDRIRNAWADAAGKTLQEAQSDIQCCYSTELASYLVKELKKASCAETALKHYRKNEDTSADRKKILAFYMADMLKIRLLRVSQGLSSKKLEEELEKQEEFPSQDDLITIRNNSTGENEDLKPIPLFSVVLTRKQLFEIVDYKNFEPWTGKISPEVPHYQKIKDLFNRRFNFSEIIEDKERLKQVIADKRRQIEEFKIKREITLGLVMSSLVL